MQPSTDDNIPCNQTHIDNIRNRYTNSLISIGIDPRNKDLLEVIADLADQLNKTMCELNNLKVEMCNKIYSIEKE